MSKERILVLASLAESLLNFRGELLKALVRSGNEVHAAAPALTPDLIKSLESIGVTAHLTPLHRTGMNPLADLRYMANIFLLARKLKIDTCLAYTIKPVIFGILAAHLANRARCFALITGLGYMFSDSAHIPRLLGSMVRSLYRLSLKRCELVFFQNPDDEKLFRESTIIPPQIPSIVVNGSGVDLLQFEPTPHPEGPPAFLMIARLLGDKGVREYVQAANIVKTHHPAARFYLVGELDCNPNSISKTELDQWIDSNIIEYLGYMNDVRPAISRCSVYVLPSYREGTPRTVLEAMSMGRAIITTDAPGCRETVQEGINGFLVPVKNITHLSAAMLRFIDDPTLCKTMGDESRRLAQKKYDVHLINSAMLNQMALS